VILEVTFRFPIVKLPVFINSLAQTLLAAKSAAVRVLSCILLLVIVLSVILFPDIFSQTFTYLLSLYSTSQTSSSEFGSAVTEILPSTDKRSPGILVPIQTFPPVIFKLFALFRDNLTLSAPSPLPKYAPISPKELLTAKAPYPVGI
jgi:hypothetical protein